LSHWSRFSLILGRSKKLSRKKGGGRLYGFKTWKRLSEYFRTYHVPAPANSTRKARNQKRNSLGKSFTGIFQKCPMNLFWPPPLIIFLQPQTEHFHFHTPLHADSLMEPTPQEPDSTRPPAYTE